MKKLLILVVLPFLFASCSKQSNMNSDIFFERFADENVFTDKILSEDNLITFTSDGFFLELKMNNNDDIVNVSMSCDDINKKSDFIGFAKSVINVYAPEEDFDEIIKSLLNDKDFSSAQTDWFTYQYVSTDNGLYLSVNNNKLNPQTAPEYSLKSNETI